MDFILIISIPILVAAGCLGWRFRRDRSAARQQEVPTRRREDARDWQRRYGADSLLPANFFPPTQNEILETLYILDYLTPGWEAGEPAQVERSFLNELALNFPTLRRADCAFPCASGEDAEQASVAARREAFRTRRAQINALNQIVSGSAAPTEIPDGAPLDLSVNARTRVARNFWPILLGSAAVFVAALLCGVRFFPAAVDLHTAEPAPFQPPPSPAPVVLAPALPPAPVAAEAVAEIVPPPSPIPTAQTVHTRPVLPPAATPFQDMLALNRQIAASQQRAVAKYPALAVEGSEINLRFVFRYKNLAQQHSLRLLDPNWPEQLVEECAAAAGVSAKRDGFTRVLGTPR